MSDIVLCSGSTPLTFSFPGEIPSPERYSSTASTAVCYEQVFTETPDPKPKTEDWFNFITGFDAGNYSAFGMSAYVTSVMAINMYPYSGGLPSTMQFRTVISTADGSGSGDSACIPVDGIAGTTDWTIYSYDSSTVAPGLFEVAHFEFSASGNTSTYQHLYRYDNWCSSNPIDGFVQWHGVPGPVYVSAWYKSRSTRTSTAELMTAFNHYLNDAQRATVTESGFWVDYPYVSQSGISAKASASGTASSNVLNWSKEYFLFWGSGSGYSDYSGYTATATIAVPTINGGAAYAYSILTDDGRNLLNTSWVETEDLPTRTVLASASAAGMLSSICGDYTGHVSASVGGFNDTYLMNPSGIVPGWDPKPTTGEDGYYWRMRSAWSAGLLTSTPYGCGLSGILELYPKGDPGSTHPILSSATGG